MYEQSEHCNFKTIFSISSCIRVFSASLPAIASGEKPSAKCRFFDMAFFQRTSTDTITVKISFKQNQLLPLTKSIQNTQARYKKYQSNKTNRFPARDCSTISEQSIKQQASIKQNQSFPWMKLLHDLRGINKKTSNLPRICTNCRIWSAWPGTVTSVSHRCASKGQS